MRISAVVAIAAPLFVSTASTRADWQYTNWGMDVSALISAAKAAGHQVQPTDDMGHVAPFAPKPTQMLTGHYQIGDVPATAYYAFAGGHLVSVVLESTGPACWSIQNAAKEKYGKPFMHSNDSLAADLRWRDEAGGNLVWSLVIKSNPLQCSMGYRPLKGDMLNDL